MRASGREVIKLHFDKNENFASVPAIGKIKNNVTIKNKRRKINDI